MKYFMAMTLSLVAAPLTAQVKPTVPPPPKTPPPATQVHVEPSMTTKEWATNANDNPFSRCLVPPEFVMMHQREIELTDAQRSKIVSEGSQAQAKLTAAQWGMSAEQQKLEDLLAATTIDPSASLKQLDKILAMENDIKRSQLTLLISVKSTLTAKQLDKLRLLTGSSHLITWTRESAGHINVAEVQACGHAAGGGTP